MCKSNTEWYKSDNYWCGKWRNMDCVIHFQDVESLLQVLTSLINQKKKKSKKASSYRKTWKTKTTHFHYYDYFKLASFLLGQWRFADATRNATRYSLNWGKSSKIIQLLGMQVSLYKSSPPPLTSVQQVVILAKSTERFTSCITATSCGNTFQRKEENQTIPERE